MTNTNAKRMEYVVQLERIFLNQENPRHEPFETQAQVIEWLCSNEEVPKLASDIAEHGLSPLDRFGLIRDRGKNGNDATYIAAEGNRRLCALKLLTDPELAPLERNSYFEKLAEKWTPVTKLPCVIFEDQEDLDRWLIRRHHGKMGGIGQKKWTSDQITRHSGNKSRNRLAMALLNYSERENLISADDRKGRLTTVQRYLDNPVMRETLGLDVSDPDRLSRNRTEEDFKLLCSQFISDMLAVNPKVNSRQKSDDIVKYARELGSLKDLTHERVEAVPISADQKKAKRSRRSKPGEPKKREQLPWYPEIRDALNTLHVWKLQNLYQSICTVSLQNNTPLLAVGTWAFLESLTARAGRTPDVNFHNFLSPERLKEYGFGTNRQTKYLRDVVERILNYGNATKHHDTIAAFNGDQLANDMEALKDLILKLVNLAIDAK